MSRSFTSNITSPLDHFSNVQVVNRDNVLELKSTYGVSNLRDIVTETGSGSVSNTVGNGEYVLSSGTTAGSTATLSSAERGRYVPGTEAEAGIGVRLPSQTLAGTAKIEWGYFNGNNGFGFGQDATGVYIFTLRDGVQSKIRKGSWNVDNLDGNGPSGLPELDLLDGNIYHLDFSWYGYGTIQFILVKNKESDKPTEKVVLHNFNPENQTSVLDPNLPLEITVDNGDQATDYQAFVAGRQFSIFTPFTPNNRVNGERRLAQGSVGTTLIPAISFRKKTAYQSVQVKLEGIDLITSANLLYEVRLNGSLTGASYATPTNTTATETACEADVSASAISGGELLYSGVIGASGVGASATGGGSTDLLRLAIPRQQPVTLLVRALTGTATVTSVVRWREEW